MSMYKLLYAGEVLDGQHPAVVRKRLATLLKLDDERMDVLFSGKAVVVKKSADDALKTRYVTAFEKAGARLRVHSLEAAGTDDVTPAASPAASSTEQAGTDDLQALPVGSDILSSNERKDFVPAEIDTNHLKVQGAVFAVDEEEETVPAPNVDHLSLAEVGAQIGTPAEPAQVSTLDVPRIPVI